MTVSAAEARAAFEAYVSSEAERLSEFTRAVATRGGPAESVLDLSRASLGPLGAWFLRTPPPGPEDSTRPAWAADLPDDHPNLRGAWLLDGLASYFAAALRRAHPSLEWRIDEDRTSTDHRRTVLAGFGLNELWPPRPVNGKLEQARGNLDRDWLIRFFDHWAGQVPAQDSPVADSDPEAELEADLDDVEVGPVSGDRDWNAEIWISEAAEAVLGEREFEGLEDRLARLDGVERIAWEDREHFLVRVRRGTDLARLREDVRAALRAALQASRS